VLSAELPGLTRDDIDIHAEDSRITIRRCPDSTPGRDIPCEQYHRSSAATAAFAGLRAAERIDVGA
jgi:HSP20 family molecular chaperone IbpA